MNAMTTEEVKEFEKKNQWATGLKVDDDWRIHISHDEFWMVVTRTAAAHKEIFGQLKPLDPQPAHQRCLERFCRHSSASKGK
jgi:hypothetical protein